MPTPAETLLLRHPGDRVLVVPKTKVALARELEAAGLVKLSLAKNGTASLSLTEAGKRRREELQLESIRRDAPEPEPPRPKKNLPATKRTASLDDLFGPGAFQPGPDDNRPVTVADLRAFEERVMARLQQLLDRGR